MVKSGLPTVAVTLLPAEKMTKKRDSQTYALFQGRREIYIGYTSDLARREAECKREGKQFSRAERISPLMAEVGARWCGERLLAAYRERHGDRAPSYRNTRR